MLVRLLFQANLLLEQDNPESDSSNPIHHHVVRGLGGGYRVLRDSVVFEPASNAPMGGGWSFLGGSPNVSMRNSRHAGHNCVGSLLLSHDRLRSSNERFVFSANFVERNRSVPDGIGVSDDPL